MWWSVLALVAVSTVACTAPPWTGTNDWYPAHELEAQQYFGADARVATLDTSDGEAMRRHPHLGAMTLSLVCRDDELSVLLVPYGGVQIPPGLDAAEVGMLNVITQGWEEPRLSTENVEFLGLHGDGIRAAAHIADEDDVEAVLDVLKAAAENKDGRRIMAAALTSTDLKNRESLGRLLHVRL